METPSKTPSGPTEVVAGVEVALRTAPQGGFLRSGNPGNKGGGRPPDALKALFEELAATPEHHETLRKILKGDGVTVTETPEGVKVMQVDLPTYLKAHQYVAERVAGKPNQAVEHSGTVGLQIQFVRERSETTSNDTEPQS